MSKWREKMKEMGGGDLTFLSSDGECIIFVVADDPVMLKGKFKGKDSERIGCPIVTDEGFVLLIVGKRVARKLSKFEDNFKENAFMITRHGVEGDINSTYEVSMLAAGKKTEHLLALKAKEYKPAALKQAIKDAKDVVSG